MCQVLTTCHTDVEDTRKEAIFIVLYFKTEVHYEIISCINFYSENLPKSDTLNIYMQSIYNP